MAPDASGVGGREARRRAEGGGAPVKSCRPMMPKTAKKKMQSRKTLAREGMAEMMDETRTFIPRMRVIVRSGRSTRTERSADAPPPARPIHVSQLTTTTTKSSQFHVDRR